ncbi:putative TIR domain, P-loop containing nucleoside triphosphate hydrolase [Medicago truncatula]|uniref:Disease resistance protein (TIR-NBS-LRR class) n=1 Tax=Medicago truncatula TaxID=3880 RepID=G7JMY5_MEDTR|nr:disease resistance protein RPV1 isoform X1 [Medicago truncatula]XP_024637922.1 disease resistance protein RPV1 isoform X1 [Medicago truncatula]AES86811.2 disease resistance protein (TIR-NBS-LRR class) [Medicago truncatula]RHN58765.1 putative TIR domain, P-loop containing nucleoside triphosphate hydrolase [Medicago truncatula]
MSSPRSLSSSDFSDFSDDIISSRTRKYDVFLSFRGEDTRASFTSHLTFSLQNAGIIVFKDDQSLERGEHISTSLLQAIEISRIAVIVFSKNYADSSWCLRELVQIMSCYSTIGQVVLPVFYDVDPSEVRRQTGDFGKSFQNLLNRISQEEERRVLKWNDGSLQRDDFPFSNKDMVRKWIDALHTAAGLAGFVVLNSRNESEVIRDIVENVTRLLDKTDLFIADNPVGVDSRVQDMIQLLETQQSNDALLLGMWGMGGIGKTTIAKSIYNKIGRNFEGRSFLENIREVWEQASGQLYLQERLMNDILKDTTTKIQSIESGKSILKERLCHKRVLIVLDDVNKLDQLNALCGSCKWFAPGSRIIITTRDKHILRGKQVDKIYIMKEMDESESLELFSWHAFKQTRPREDFSEISKNVVKYSAGLPLALEVLGSYLFDREILEWRSVLDKLKRIPNDQVHKKLKISYDGLNDDTQKEIFLDISCFFIGMDRNDVIRILDGCGFFAGIGISVLVERSLVTVDDKNKLGMHDLLRDMGREIIREKSPKEPEEHSRLWFHEDVIDVLLEHTGTKAVEGLSLKLPGRSAQRFSTKTFENMKKLRLLQLSGVQLDGDFKHLSRKLRWLQWNGFPLTCIPSNFYQRNLVSIVLENSNIRLVWKEMQGMEQLKILNLSHSQYLTQTPDFSYLPNLEKLVLKDCPRLSEISQSIGHLKKILLINLKDCISLCNLPRNIYTLKSLKTLILSGCSMIDTLEEDLEQMESLTTLIANNTGITKVPFSIVRSKRIGFISLCGYEGFSRDVFPSIISSWMSPTNGLSPTFQTTAGMSSLVFLNATNSISHDISSISYVLPKLQSLWLECGSELQLSQDTAIILNALSATNSKELESTATTSQVSEVKTSSLIECCDQMPDSATKNYMKSLLIQMGTSCLISNILKERILQNLTVDGRGSFLLPGDDYPNWLSFNAKGYSVIFEVPQVEGCSLKTIMCIVYSSSPYDITSDGLRNVLVINHTKTTIQLYKREALSSFENADWQRVISNMEPGDKVEIVIVMVNNVIVTKTAVYLIYDEPIDGKMDHCDSQDTNVIVGGDENECSSKIVSPQVESTDDSNQRQKRRKHWWR